MISKSRNVLISLLSKSRRTRRANLQRAQRRFLQSLCIESLETRELLAADLAWAQQLGADPLINPSSDSASAVAADGSVYVAGATSGTLPGNVSQGGGSDGFVSKYDASGNLIWTAQLGGGGAEGLIGIAVDSDGIYVTGYASPGEAGGQDVFVGKLDLSGNVQWTSNFGSAGSDRGQAIAADATGIYVAGYASGAITGQTHAGSNDGFVARLDHLGALQWLDQFGSSSSDYPAGLAVDDGALYVAGTTSGTLPGQTSAGRSDVFLKKYDTSGTAEWTRQFGTSGLQAAGGVAVWSGDIFVVGRTSFPDFPGESGGNIFVARFDAAGVEQYVEQFGASASNINTEIAVNDEGIFVGGHTNNAVMPSETSAGGMDAFAFRLDHSASVVWVTQFGTSANDWGAGIAVDANGVYVVGQTFGAFPGETLGGNRDAYLARLNLTDGSLLSVDQFGGFRGSSEWASSVSVDVDGSVYITGQTTAGFPGETHFGGSDGYVAKYDATGTLLWVTQVGTTGYEYFEGIAVYDGDVYVSGMVSGAFPGETHLGGRDAVVVKLDSAGAVQWARQFGTPQSDYAYEVAVDASGIYVTGNTRGAFPGESNQGSTDAFVAKLDLTGSLEWTRQLGSSGSEYSDGVIIVDSAVYIAGDTYGALPGQTNAGSRDLFVAKYDTAGAHLWTRQIGTAAGDAPYGEALAAYNGDIYLSGSTSGTFPGQTNLGSTDAVVMKLDAAGDVIWTSQFGSSASDDGYGIAVNESGIYVTGETQGEILGASNAGFRDGFVAKLDLSGTPLWAEQFGNSAYNAGYGVAVDGLNIYVAGQSEGQLPGATAYGGYDASLVKFVETVSPQNLVVALDEISQGGTLEATATAAELNDWIAAIEQLAPISSGPSTTIELVLTVGDYSGPSVIRVQPGYRLRITGPATINGASPAFQVESGEVIVSGVTFANGTDAPTIVVHGGSLTLRDSTILESTGGDQAAIQILGGTLDLGSASDPGGNTLVVHGSGEYFENASDRAIVALGNSYQVEDVTVFTPADPVVVGGANDETFVVESGPSDGDTVITGDGLAEQTISGAASVVIYAGGGNDDVRVAGGFSARIWLFGQTGNDKLRGGAAGDVLVGGDGDDLLVGKSGRDLLIGGSGADRVVGNSDDDVLIAGVANLRESEAAEILLRWSAEDDVVARQNAATEYMNSQGIAVDDDGERDILTGSAGTDWFFASLTGEGMLDKVTDLDDELLAVDLDFILGD